MNDYQLKQRLQAGQATVGSWITLGHPAIAEIFAKAGFDWLVVDFEHSTLSMDEVGQLIRVIDLAGVPALVRLTSNDDAQIKRVMDAGAYGIVVPMVNTLEEATRAIAATRYAPIGARGVGLARAQGYGDDFQNYLTWQENGPLVIVQIEHIKALERLDLILAVEGVDGFMIGPYDLSCSMGIPGEFNHPEFIEALSHIREMGRQVNCPSGIHVVEPNPVQLQQAIQDEYQFIAYGVDIRMLDVGARDGMKLVRENLT